MKSLKRMLTVLLTIAVVLIAIFLAGSGIGMKQRWSKLRKIKRK